MILKPTLVSKLILIAIALQINFKSHAKSENSKTNSATIDTAVYTIVEVMPVYPGGDEALLEYVGETVIYPPVAKIQDITGKVYVSYVVDKLGKIANPKVVQGAHPLLDAEALRVVKTLSGYAPGTQNGDPVAVQFTLPIRFTLNLEAGAPQKHYDNAMAFYDKGQAAQGDEALNTAISLGSSWYIQAYIARAERNLKSANYEAALQDVNSAMVIDSNRADLLVLRGKCFFGKRMLIDAMNDLKQALQINSWSYGAQYYLGRVLIDLEMYQEAESHLTTSIESRPKEGDLYFQRAISRSKLKKMTEACEDWEKAKKFGNKDVVSLIEANCH